MKRTAKAEKLLQKQQREQSPEEMRVKLRRGFKKCKNPACSHLLHIHSKECSRCKHAEQFSTLSKSAQGQKSKENVLDFARKLIEIPPDSKVPKKYLDSIYVFKKNILQKDQSNIDKNFLAPLQLDLQPRIYGDYAHNKQLVKEVRLAERPREKKWVLLCPKEVVCKESFHVLPNATNWNTYVHNFGCPIMSVQFAPRATQPQANNKTKDMSQYLAVSLQLNKYEYTNPDDALLTKQHRQTIDEFGLQRCHVSGVQYEGQGTIAMLRITECGEVSYLMYYLVFQSGCVLKMKWCPKFSASEQEIGLLGMVTAMGVIEIVSVPILDRRGSSLLTTNVIQRIKIGQQLITTFDWMVSKENDILAVGDQNGGVYLIKLGPDLHQQGYIILNFIHALHSAEITDLQFYLHSDSPLLASAGYDGSVKVLQPLQSSAPLLDFNLSSKGILEIQWDSGGKYIQVIRDDPVSRALLVSFFAVEKGPKGHEAGYELSNRFESRHLGNLSGALTDVVVSSTQGHGQTYFANQQGKVYVIPTESLRKLAVKKEKKQTQQAQLISHITIEEGNQVEVTIHSLLQQEDPKKVKNEPQLLPPSMHTCLREIHVCPSDTKSLCNNLLVQGGLQGVLVICKV